MADELPLAHNETQLVIMRPSVTLGIILLNYRERTVEGLTVRASRTNQSGYNNIFFEKSTAKNLKSTDLSSIYLPKNLIVKANKKVTNNFRVTSFLFGNSNLFRTKEEEQSSLAKSNSGVNISKTVNSKVFSVAVKTVRLQNLTDDEEIISSFLPLIPVDSTPTECVFWDFSGSG